MRHAVKLNKEEKARIWLDLCDFSFRLMQKALSAGQLAQKLEKMRRRHLAQDHRILEALARTIK